MVFCDLLRVDGVFAAVCIWCGWVLYSAVCGCLLVVLFALVLGWYTLGFVLLLGVFVRLLVIVLFGLFAVGFPVVCALYVGSFGLIV